MNHMNIASIDYLETVLRTKSPSVKKFIAIVEEMIIFHAAIYQIYFRWSEEIETKWNTNIEYMSSKLSFVTSRVEENH